MHILVVSCVFPPEPVVSAQTSAHIAEAMAQREHDVTVICPFPNRPGGKLFPGYLRSLFTREKALAGYQIIRCFATLSGESRLLSRLLENLTFGLSSGWLALTAHRPDVIYVNTWPIVATSILFLVASVRRIPLVIFVMDVYPEALVVQQRISARGAVAKLMRWLDGMIARHCAHVIVISERFVDIYLEQRRVPSERLSLVPNWIDGSRIDIDISREQFRLRKGIPAQDFLLVYAGNVGVAAGVEFVIEAMRLLTDKQEIRLLIAGAGSQLAVCQQMAQEIPGQSVYFHSPWAADETSEVLRSADLLILPTQGEQSLASVPSKLLSYMLAGRPILATAVPNSDLAEFVIRSQCGWVIPPNRPDLLAAQIRAVMQFPPTERQRRGEMGREYVLRHFAKDSCLPKIVEILEEAGK